MFISLFFLYCLRTGLSNGFGSNTPLTPSARISALNIVSDLLRKVGVSQSSWLPVFRFSLSLESPHLSLISYLFECVHLRLWSRSWPPAGTLPRTRKQGRRTLWTTATCSTQTRLTTHNHSTRRILTKREWNQNVSAFYYLFYLFKSRQGWL